MVNGKLFEKTISVNDYASLVYGNPRQDLRQQIITVLYKELSEYIAAEILQANAEFIAREIFKSF